MSLTVIIGTVMFKVLVHGNCSLACLAGYVMNTLSCISSDLFFHFGLMLKIPSFPLFSN